ncbi:hypothetical protein ACU4GR_13425 [Methylobacterium oryzae CBMB20]
MSAEPDPRHEIVAARLMRQLYGFAQGLNLDVETTRGIVDRVIADIAAGPGRRPLWPGSQLDADRVGLGLARPVEGACAARPGPGLRPGSGGAVGRGAEAASAVAKGAGIPGRERAVPVTRAPERPEAWPAER